MTHKTVTIKTGRHKVISYIDTEIPFERSLSEIQTLLLKYKCERIIHDYQIRQKGSVVEPLHTLGFVQKGTKFIIEFPVVFHELTAGLRIVITDILISTHSPECGRRHRPTTLHVPRDDRTEETGET